MTETIKLSDLQPDNHNANKGTERGRALLEKSLHQYGAGRSILLDKNGRIIAGNKTAATAGEIGIDDVIVVRTKGDKLVAVLREDLDLSDEAARMLAYADNRVSQVDLEWDAEALLADITAGLPLDDFWFEDELKDIFADVPGYDNGAGESSDAEPQVNKAEELRQKWGVEPGQLWRLPSRTPGHEHRLICGDCTDTAVVERVMGGEKIDIITTDPPYGVDYDGGTTKREKLKGDDSPSLYFPALSAWKPFCNSHLAFYLWYADGDQAVAQAVAQAGYQVRRNLIWNKNQAQYGALSQQYKQKHEPFLYGHLKGKSPYWAGDATEITVWDIARDSVNDLHPTQKPPKLYERAIKNSSESGNVVFDGFGGSGPVLIASENLQRQARVVELDAGYCGVILQRYADAFGITPKLVETAVPANG